MFSLFTMVFTPFLAVYHGFHTILPRRSPLGISGKHVPGAKAGLTSEPNIDQTSGSPKRGQES